MGAAPVHRPRLTPAHRWWIGFHVLVSALALLALVVMVNYLAARHLNWRFHWSAHTQRELTPLTLRLLKSLTNDVRVVVFFHKDNAPSLYNSVAALLKEYSLVTPRVRVDSIDYVNNPGAGELFKQRYKRSFKTDKDLVLFDCGGKTKEVYDSELSDYDISNLLSGRSREVRRTAFKGELLFTSAIASVTDPTQPTACFLEGHGEYDPDDDQDQTGYSKLAAVLRERNIQIEHLSLLGTNEVPPDALLVIAGPTHQLPEGEANKVADFLTHGGRLFVLLRQNVRTGLERVLAEWGVATRADLCAYDRTSAESGLVVTTNVSDHPTVSALAQVGLAMYLPVPVGKLPSPKPEADAPAVKVIIQTSTNGVASEFRGGKLLQRPTDLRGAIPLAVAVEKGGIQGVRADRGTTRLVVVGESMFLANQLIETYANRDFAALAADWLLDRAQLLGGIGPRPIQEYRILLTKPQLRRVRWVLLGGMPGGVLLVGLLVWWARRR